MLKIIILLLTFRGQNLTLRVTFSIIIELIIFIITVTLAIIDSTAWPGTFFYLTMSSVVVLNMANGVYQNSIYGLAAKFPMKYTNAVVLGSNISGVLATLISITTTAFTSNVKNAAIYYFITALFFLFACFDTYFALPLSVSNSESLFKCINILFPILEILSLPYATEERSIT